MVVGVRRTGLSISQTADLLGFRQPSLGFTENGPRNRKYPVSGSCVDDNALLMSEENGLVRDDRKATVTQITNQGMQNTISEHTTRQTLKQMTTAAEDHTGAAPVR